jgi:hypothetical protein
VNNRYARLIVAMLGLGVGPVLNQAIPAGQVPTPGSATAIRTTAGELIVEPPTVAALGFEWRVQGDANHNAQAAIAYRRVGETAWKIGLPLLRIQQEPIEPPGRGGGPGESGGGSPFRFVPPNMFAGSVFDLEPDTEYEARLRLSDADGVSGQAERVVRARTRALPKAIPRTPRISTRRPMWICG